MYAGIDSSSRAMNTLTRSRLDDIITMPSMLHSSST